MKQVVGTMSNVDQGENREHMFGDFSREDVGSLSLSPFQKLLGPLTLEMSARRINNGSLDSSPHDSSIRRHWMSEH